jgi:hypothetical protein
MRHRQQLTEHERDRRRARDRERLRQATEQLLSSEGWRRWVRARSSNGLARYSLTNQLLVALQSDGRATFVAGFKQWLALGYCVRKGERAIRVMAKRALSHLMQSRLGAASVHRGDAWISGFAGRGAISSGVCGSS